MPLLREGDGGEFRRPKELKSYPLEALYSEVAFVAYHFHWSSEEVLEMVWISFSCAEPNRPVDETSI